jgi:hypothetical protein
MDKLEQYVEQVCRGIGGPWELREHVRQELREHLLDAVAQHKAAGLAEPDAVDKALAEFGKPEEVRSELESAYGQRMTWIIDKAMQWKEKTMKAKWLWMTWAYTSVVLVIVLAVMWITFANVFLVPRFQKLMHDGIIDPGIIDDTDAAWMPAFLDKQHNILGNNATWLLLLAIAAVGVFEWRVKSENKSWIRLSAWGTVALGLIVVGVLMAGTMVISFELGVPAMGGIARPWAVEQVGNIDTSLKALEQAQAKNDWNTMQEQGELLSTAMKRLSARVALRSLASSNDPAKIEELHSQMRSASESLREARNAIDAKDAGKLEAALDGVRKSYGPVRDAAKRPVR